MNKSIHSQIKAEYERRRKIAHDEQMERKEGVYLQIPRIREIDRQIHLAGIRCTRQILLSGEQEQQSLEELNAELQALQQEKASLLSEAGLAPDFLELRYQCPLCEDTGVVNRESGGETCACYRQQYLDLLYSHYNLQMTRIENFSTFCEEYYPDTVNEKKYGIKIAPREYIRNLRNKCMKFIENFDSPEEKNLFFSGPTGVGKTFMSNCIAAELLSRGRNVLYLSAPVLFNIINEYKVKLYKEDQYEDDSYRSILDVELLIIDDLGTEARSAARYAELLTILTTRHSTNLTQPCKTIISTNIGVKELYDYYDERVASRIVGSFDMFRFIGEDIRTIKKQQSTKTAGA